MRAIRAFFALSPCAGNTGSGYGYFALCAQYAYANALLPCAGNTGFFRPIALGGRYGLGLRLFRALRSIRLRKRPIALCGQYGLFSPYRPWRAIRARATAISRSALNTPTPLPEAGNASQPDIESHRHNIKHINIYIYILYTLQYTPTYSDIYFKRQRGVAWKSHKSSQKCAFAV